jgi:hypothetical protein
MSDLTPSADSLTGQLTDPIWAIKNHEGEFYASFLKRFHQNFKPRNYFEIGVQTGGTIEFAECASIGVDPFFQIDRPFMLNKPSCFLYQMTSDSFFKAYKPDVIFGEPVQMAFLDGMHWFEFLLRDFINTERCCSPNSMIFMHDCIPTDAHVARRIGDDYSLIDQSTNPNWWGGDVWKTVAILLKYRPDLRIISFNAPPTGLVAITNLAPSSSFLSTNYFDLIDEYNNITIGDAASEYFKLLKIVPTDDFSTFGAQSAAFWL